MFRFLHQTEGYYGYRVNPNADGHRILTPRPHRHDPSAVSEKLKLLELEFADLMALSSLELKEEIDLGLASGYPLSHSRWTVTGAANGPFLCLAGSKQKNPREAGEDEW